MIPREANKTSVIYLSNSLGAFPLLVWGGGDGDDFFLVGWGGWDFELAANGDRDGQNCTGVSGLDDSRVGVLQEAADDLAAGFVVKLSGQMEDPSSAGGRHSDPTATPFHFRVVVLCEGALCRFDRICIATVVIPMFRSEYVGSSFFNGKTWNPVVSS